RGTAMRRYSAPAPTRRQPRSSGSEAIKVVTTPFATASARREMIDRFSVGQIPRMIDVRGQRSLDFASDIVLRIVEPPCAGRVAGSESPATDHNETDGGRPNGVKNRALEVCARLDGFDVTKDLLVAESADQIFRYAKPGARPVDITRT